MPVQGAGSGRLQDCLNTVMPCDLTLCRELGLVGYLSAMTVEHGSVDLYLSAIQKLGPDPLREDADKEVSACVCVCVCRAP